MSNSEIWLMNHADHDLMVAMNETHPPRIVNFKPWFPLPFARDVALQYLNKYYSLRPCDNPKDFLRGQAIKHLIIRDAGIGDLILMEPCFRYLADTGRLITLVTHFSELFHKHPSIHEAKFIQHKHEVDMNIVKNFDTFNDMRSFSEIHPKRAEWHRTDIYSAGFGIELQDKEPRIYADPKPILQKRNGKKYIGFQFDASENYRRFPAPRAKQLIEFFLKQDSNNYCILLGNREYVSIKHDRVINYQGKTNLQECISIIYDLDYMFAADSGLLHIALAMHIPTLAWFSIITPDLRMRYYKGRYSILKPTVQCHPCGNITSGTCQHGDASQDPDYKIPVFMAPCSDFNAEDVYNKLMAMTPSDAPLVYR